MLDANKLQKSGLYKTASLFVSVCVNVFSLRKPHAVFVFMQRMKSVDCVPHYFQFCGSTK